MSLSHHRDSDNYIQKSDKKPKQKRKKVISPPQRTYSLRKRGNDKDQPTEDLLELESLTTSRKQGKEVIEDEESVITPVSQKF